MRQNTEDSFGRFQSSLSDQLDLALKTTGRAMQFALQRRASRSEAIKIDIEQANRSVAELEDILTELQAMSSPLTAQTKHEGTRRC
jgi:hypothetical protein